MVRSLWRELGFYFEYDDKAQEICIFADEKGFREFIEVIRSYGTDPNTEEVGHDHLGPYYNLTLQTSTTALCGPDFIQGMHEDFLKLASEVESKLGKLKTGESFISEHFERTGSVTLRFIQQQPEFDPSTLDSHLQKQTG